MPRPVEMVCAAAELMCELVGSGIGSAPEEVLVCQTGLIGVRFPVDRIESGTPHLVSALGPTTDAASRAAVAMMTTDTVSKEIHVEAGGFSVGGMAKGAAMLAPNMATMLALLTTDAPCEPATLTRILREAVSESFNEMTVDGCCSTNDTVILLSSGLAARTSDGELLDAVKQACGALSEQMVADAEGASKSARGHGVRRGFQRECEKSRAPGGRLPPREMLDKRRGPLLGKDRERARLCRRRVRS